MWRLKILAKILLSRIPVNYNFWSRIGLFRHGKMDNPAYAVSVFSEHLNKSELGESLVGKTILELGPGDSVATAMLAANKGGRSILIDSGDFATKDMSRYKRLAEYLGSERKFIYDDISQFLTSCNESLYLTDGLNSLRSLPSSSVDFIFSNAVLEHVPLLEFDEIISEFSRIIKKDCLMSHEVDYRDHFGGKKNNLRFSKRVWESSFFAKSGFYTNRLSASQMINIFNKHDFETVFQEYLYHEEKICRRKLDSSFSNLSDADLCTSIGKLVLRKK